MLKRVITAVILSALGSHGAFAQFPGDAFFVTPSISVEEDGQGDLVLALFAGADVFGAASVELTWDESALEVSATDLAFPDATAVFVEPGRLRIAAANPASLTEPTATAQLATFAVRPLASAGSRIEIDARLIGALTAESGGFPSAQAFGAEILVVQESSSSASVRTGALSVAIADGRLERRRARLRPEGQAVQIEVFDGDRRTRALLVAPARAE